MNLKPAVMHYLVTILGARVSAQEDEVASCLDAAGLISLWRDSDPRGTRQEVVLHILLSSINVRIPAEAWTTIEPEMDDHAPLPRLPFPITSFELYDEDGDHNTFCRLGNGELVLVTLVEKSPGEEWLGWAFSPERHETHISPNWAPFRMTWDGKRRRTFGFKEGQVTEAPSDSWSIKGLPACAELATARGATRNPDIMTRQMRRAFERRWGFAYPSIYTLEIGSTMDEDHDRDGYREYHCRWLVRGHWRHTGAQRTWIRPYIKGPANAPFKGRPMYRTTEEAAS